MVTLQDYVSKIYNNLNASRAYLHLHLELQLYIMQPVIIAIYVYWYISIPLKISSVLTFSSSPCEDTLSNNILTVWNKI